MPLHVSVVQFIPFITESYSNSWTYNLFLHSTVDRHLCHIHYLVIMNKAVINICVQTGICVNTWFHCSWVNTYELDCWATREVCIITAYFLPPK